MGKQAPNVEWQIAESDADWERLHAPPLGRAPDANRRLRLQHYLWGGATLLLVVVGVGNWWWHAARTTLPQPAAAITATTPPASGTGASGRDSLVASVIRDQTASDGQRHFASDDSGLRTAIQRNASTAQGKIELLMILSHGAQAVTRVVMYTEHGEPAYRQTRFYRRTSTAWLQTEPDAALWGPERSLETPSFVFHFRQQDAQAVIAVAPQLEVLYTTLRRNVGLPVTPSAEKMVIEVSVTEPPGHMLPWVPRPEGLRVPSPAIYWAPVGLTDADLLVQSIALPLFAHLLAQASEHYQIGLPWQSMLNGLYLWQVWESGLPLSSWREEVVKWLYVDLPAIGSGPAVVLPDHYEALCAAHKLWLVNPSSLGVPLFCNERDRKDPHLIWGGVWPPLARLDQLVVSATQEWVGGPSLPESEPGVPVALATVIEYTVATYGRERLPMLVAGLGQYDTWETLLPAVFGVSATEFEAGWQAYLVAHYTVSPDALQQ